jgi:hypothetical protein
MVPRTEPTMAIHRANVRVPKMAMTKASDGSEEGDDEGVSDGELMVPKRATTKASQTAS